MFILQFLNLLKLQKTVSIVYSDRNTKTMFHPDTNTAGKWQFISHSFSVRFDGKIFILQKTLFSELVISIKGKYSSVSDNYQTFVDVAISTEMQQNHSHPKQMNMLTFQWTRWHNNSILIKMTHFTMDVQDECLLWKQERSLKLTQGWQVGKYFSLLLVSM